DKDQRSRQRSAFSQAPEVAEFRQRSARSGESSGSGIPINISQHQLPQVIGTGLSLTDPSGTIVVDGFSDPSSSTIPWTVGISCTDRTDRTYSRTLTDARPRLGPEAGETQPIVAAQDLPCHSAPASH